MLDALAKAGVAFVALKENIRVEGKRDIQTKVNDDAVRVVRRGRARPESAASPEQEFEVAWRGGDGLLDQIPDPEPVDGGPTRAAVDWHELAKHAPDVDVDERSMPAPTGGSCAGAAA